jgi:rubrerythrin
LVHNTKSTILFQGFPNPEDHAIFNTVIQRFLLRLILEEAIRREEEAYRFYEAALEPVRAPEAQALLRRLCAEELRHRLKLQELQLQPENLELEARTPEESELLTDSGPAPEPSAELADLQPADVWRLALRKEQLAVAHYGLLARKIRLRVPRRVFSFLAAEEQRHVDWVRAALEGQA